jgi:DNA-binding NarL/FixJ family response regulator
MNKIRIFLADDHVILREGLRYILNTVPDYQVIGESGDGREALEKIEKLKPDVVILDISMPTMTGIEVSRQLRKYHPEIKIIVLSRHDNEEYVNQLMKYGIHGYILKDNASDDLLKAIAEVLNGNMYLSPRITKNIIEDYLANKKCGIQQGADSIFSKLSIREIEILKLIAEGKSNNQIASLIFISDKTVKVHRANIMKKMGVHKATDLVKVAIKYGLTES